MKILLFDISNVRKTSIGQILIQKFLKSYDLCNDSSEIIKELNLINECVFYEFVKNSVIKMLLKFNKYYLYMST